ncbi:MAG: SurA N-terminal domain-containing protein [bacterium]|nr:SurA N-terminal domain-containing protein [bacterium]
MLNKLANKKLIMIISLIAAIAFLGLIYLEWGRGGVTATGEIASVNGHSIYLQDLRELYEQLKEYNKDKMTKENASQIDRQIMEEALRRVMQKYLILQQAAKARITVSDEEILKSVVAMKMFQTEDGKFNPYLYQQLPNAVKTKLENEKREEITSQLFQIRLYDAVKTSDLDIRTYYQEKYTQCKVRFILVRINEESGKAGLDTLLQANTERAKAEKVIDTFLQAVKKGVDFNAAANALGLSVFTTDYFQFFGPIKKPGSQERFNDIEFQDVYVQAFRLNPFQSSEKISLNHAFVALQPVSRVNPDWNKFFKELPTLKNEYDARLRQYALQDWYMNIIQKSKIVNNLAKLYTKQ